MKKVKQLLIMITAFFVMPPMIIKAYEQRGYFAIGGEWLIVPLVALVIYGLVPSVKQLYNECFEESEE